MVSTSPIAPEYIIYADDDIDDRFLFEHAFRELSPAFNLTMVSNGQQLMDLLNTADSQLPYALFLDLNMPRMNGVECLVAIKASPRLNLLPVILVTTSLIPSIVEDLYVKGALYYMRKPTEPMALGEMIGLALSQIPGTFALRPPIGKFLLTHSSSTHVKQY